MPRSAAELLMKRLQEEGKRVTWRINSTVYTLEGVRFIVWAHPKPQGRPFLVARLGPEYGDDHDQASNAFLDDQRRKGWPTESPEDTNSKKIPLDEDYGSRSPTRLGTNEEHPYGNDQSHD